METAAILQRNRCSLAICICTFKRHEGLVQLLEGLNNQFFSAAPPQILLIIVDNSPDGDAAHICESDDWAWPLLYLHEPQPGISYARNKALAAVPIDSDFIAMIDDDEIPDPDWLDQLLAAQGRSGADIVVGRTTPKFPTATPGWISATGFFCKPQDPETYQDLDPDPPAATCNVLLRAQAIRESGLSFDPAFALSGGEDKLLFQSLKIVGYRLAWCSNAHATEFIPAERANFAYMWREAYRRGCVKFPVKRRLKSGSLLRSVKIALRLCIRSLGRIVADLLGIVIHLRRGRPIWVPHALNIADHLGTIAGVLQVPNRHYRPRGA
ncbi:MAG: glycosyltransferase [Halioglobus sp.]|nr:glycosyltransferase [Halioglobus sp.]